MFRISRFAGALILVLIPALARADEVVLKNGDHITGTVGTIDGGVMTFTSPALGKLSIKLTDIQSYKTDKPADVELKTGASIKSAITNGNEQTVATANQKTTPVSDIKAINPPPEQWHGSVIANGILNRGNTNTETAGVSANAVLRRDDFQFNDRFTLNGDYNYGNTGRGDNKTTTTDNADALFKYDRFFSPKLYGYGLVGYDHDRIAQLNVRLTPGAGIGYQWVESAKLNFQTEGGASYLYEDFQDGGVDQQADFRLAYHVDAALNPHVSVFHDVEYLAAFQDPSDYIINADAGINAKITDNFFTQFKVLYKRNDRPADHALKDDLSYILGVGWNY